MRVARKFFGATLVTALMGVPSAMWATTTFVPTYSRLWTGCTTGTLRSCNSIRLTTQAVMSGTTRIGTTVVVSMHNYMGQGFGPDNTAGPNWAALHRARFYFQGQAFAAGSNTATTSLAGGATGTVASGGWTSTYVSPFTDASSNAWGVLRLEGLTNRIGGCGLPGSGTNIPTLGTCLSGSEVVVAFSTSESFDAFDAELLFNVNGRISGSAIQTSCYTNSALSTVAGSPTACSDMAVVDTATVPEPITMALLGTGLLGVGGARLRRRKNNVQEG